MGEEYPDPGVSSEVIFLFVIVTSLYAGRQIVLVIDARICECTHTHIVK